MNKKNTPGYAIQAETFSRNIEKQPELIRRYQENGDAAAIATLCEHFTPLINTEVKKVKTKNKKTRLQEADMRQEARLAFIQAVVDFDPEQSPALAPFAKQRIHYALQQYILDQSGPLRLCKSSGDRRVYYALRRLAMQKDPEEPISEDERLRIQKDTRTGPKAFKRGLDAANLRETSVENLNLQDPVACPEKLEANRSLRARAREALVPIIRTLDPLQRDIITNHIIADKREPMEAIASRHGQTAQFAYRKKRELLKMMLAHVERAGLKAADLPA